MYFFHSNGFLLVFVWPFTVTIEAIEEKFTAHCAPLTLRHFNPVTKNCDLSDKEESWITSMLVLGLKDLFSKERLMVRERSLERTLPAACIVETSKQHMKSLKEVGGEVEKVDEVDGKGQKPQCGTPCGELQCLTHTRFMSCCWATLPY